MKNILYEFKIDSFSICVFKLKFIGFTFKIFIYLFFFNFIIPFSKIFSIGIHFCIELIFLTSHYRIKIFLTLNNSRIKFYVFIILSFYQLSRKTFRQNNTKNFLSLMYNKKIFEHNMCIRLILVE